MKRKTYFNKCSGLVRKEKKFVIKKEVCENINELRQLRKKMNKREVLDIYFKRFALSEQTFGVIRKHRKFNEFLVRGLDKVKTIWNIVCTSFNLRRLYNLCLE